MITVVVPTLGTRISYLELSLASIRQQRADVRIVLATTSEGARRLPSSIAADEVNICERPGIGAAVNSAWMAFPNEYVAWLGDDDLLAPESLNTAARELRDGKLAAVYGDCGIIDDRGEELYSIRPRKIASHLARVGPNVIPQPGSLFRYSAVERVNLLDEDLNYCMDLDLFLKLRRYGLGYVPKKLAMFRRHNGSLTVLKTDPHSETRMVQARYLGRIAQRIHARTAVPAITTGKLIDRYFRLMYTPSRGRVWG